MKHEADSVQRIAENLELRISNFKLGLTGIVAFLIDYCSRPRENDNIKDDLLFVLTGIVVVGSVWFESSQALGVF